MEKLVEFFQQNNELVRHWGYLALFLAAWIEGLNSMILGGFAASLGQLNPLGVFVSMAAGHTFSGVCWYAVGYYGGAKPLYRWGRHIKLGPDRLELARGYFDQHGGKAILITKFTVAFTIAALIVAGVIKMRFKKFFAYNALGSAGWTVITMAFGFTFGLSYRLLLRYIEGFTKAVVFFFVFLGGAVALYHTLRWLFRTRLFHTLGSSIAGIFGAENGTSTSPTSDSSG